MWFQVFTPPTYQSFYFHGHCVCVTHYLFSFTIISLCSQNIAPLSTPPCPFFSLYHLLSLILVVHLFTPPNYWTPYNHVVKSLFLGFKRVWHTWKKCVIKMFYLILRKHALFYNKFLKCFEICWFHGGRNLYLHKWND